MGFNTKDYRFADISVSIFGQKLSGFRGVSYKKKQEKSLLHAAGDEPIGIQRGNKSYEGEISMLKSDYDAMNLAARTAGYDDIIDLPGFPIVIAYSNDTNLTVDTLLNVEFMEFDEGMKQGDSFIEMSIPILFTGIKKV